MRSIQLGNTQLRCKKLINRSRNHPTLARQTTMTKGSQFVVSTNILPLCICLFLFSMVSGARVLAMACVLVVQVQWRKIVLLRPFTIFVGNKNNLCIIVARGIFCTTLPIGTACHFSSETCKKSCAEADCACHDRLFQSIGRRSDTITCHFSSSLLSCCSLAYRRCYGNTTLPHLKYG